MEDAVRTYDTMLSSGEQTFRLYLLFRYKALHPIFRLLWNRTKSAVIEGISIDDARQVKRHVHIPVLCTGGFQTASYIRRVISEGYCDGVAIARALVANPDLVKIFGAGKDVPDKPCTYCNKCLLHVIEDPFGCYDVSRYDDDYEKMMREIMSVFEPSL
jgi:tRNA-dihydrouridine synthase